MYNVQSAQAQLAALGHHLITLPLFDVLHDSLEHLLRYLLRLHHPLYLQSLLPLPILLHDFFKPL